MVDTCANPKCARPLKYLRDGRIYIFDVGSVQAEPGGKRMRHLEHYWLCGDCSASLILVQDHAGVHVAARPALVPEQFDSGDSAVASSGWRNALARGA
ncbi:MAG TPA: hypothetical protein VHX13_09675 [Acidobacteriaceae bacterium]|nr:hypothetical protein [Acidobacteriaceae bacterium]